MKEYALGQIFLAAEWVSAKQLANAVEVANRKSLPLGRAFRFLRMITEEELEDAIYMQRLFRDGLDPQLGFQLMKQSREDGMRVAEALANAEKAGLLNMDVKIGELSQDSAVSALFPTAESDKTDAASIEGTSDWLSLGDALFRENKLKRAEQAYSNYLQECELEHGVESLEYCEALSRISDVFMSTDRLLEAENLQMDILRIRRILLGGEHPEIEKSLEDMGDICRALGEHDRAITCYRDSLLIKQRRLPADGEKLLAFLRKLHPYFLKHDKGVGRRKIGQILVEIGVLSDEKLLSALTNSLANEVPLGVELAMGGEIEKNMLSSVLSLQLMVREKQISEAIGEACLKAALFLGRTLDEVLLEIRPLSEQEESSRDYAALLELQEKLLTTELQLGPRHHEVARIAAALADMHMERKFRLDAEFLYKRALSIWGTNFDSDNLTSIYDCARKLASLYVQMSRWNEAEPLLAKCLGFSQMLQKSGDETFKMMIALAKVKHMQRDTNGTASVLGSAVSVLDRVTKPVLIPVDDLLWMAGCLEAREMHQDMTRLVESQVQARLAKGLQPEEKLESLLKAGG